MPDSGQPIETVASLDKTAAPEPAIDKAVMDTILQHVYDDMGKLGLGPLSTLKPMNPFRNHPGMLPIDYFDAKKFPILAIDTPSDLPGHLDLPFKLEPPSVKFEGDGYTVAFTPTADPIKGEGGIKVSGTF